MKEDKVKAEKDSKGNLKIKVPKLKIGTKIKK